MPKGFKTQVVSRDEFDGIKFATRYGLGLTDYWLHGTVLHYPDTLPDNAADPGPLDSANLDAPESPISRPDAAIAAVEAGSATPQQVVDVLQYALKSGSLQGL